ncbi:hypothetical protein M3Y99_01987700 [Aphelenchoides fujianensis]|nr:hypothetical protein M3Y99_01987700 [Aphelenchoides fujianensis]
MLIRMNPFRYLSCLLEPRAKHEQEPATDRPLRLVLHAGRRLHARFDFRADGRPPPAERPPLVAARWSVGRPTHHSADVIAASIRARTRPLVAAIFLARHGADVNRQNKAEKSPLDLVQSATLLKKLKDAAADR